ncbi:MAG: hypothetical protein HZB79_04040 [Deltaproteobacteria bacterium]|nr:hypothetical protein [Deltaproteobacteria bacterium]
MRFWQSKRDFKDETTKNSFLLEGFYNYPSRITDHIITVGGGDAIHDWNYILSRLGILNLDQIAGNMVYGLGILLLLASVAAGFYFSFDTNDTEVKFTEFMGKI